MLVTIFADASFCPDTLGAGWGGWAKSERGTTRGSGTIVPSPSDSTVAELLAIEAAVRMALVSGAAGAVALLGDCLLIQSDSQRALYLLGWRSERKHRPNVTALYDEARAVAAVRLAATGCEVQLRWIKGHDPSWRDSPRHAVNRFCDQEARAHMLRRRRLCQTPQ